MENCAYLRKNPGYAPEFVYAHILSCFPMSSTLYCYVNAKKYILKKEVYV